MNRFIKEHKKSFNNAFSEIKEGKNKSTSHWIWYIYPQYDVYPTVTPPPSPTSKKYFIKTIDEIEAYLNNKYLIDNYIQINEELLKHLNKKVLTQIFNNLDDFKVIKSLILFFIVSKYVNINNDLTELLKKILLKLMDDINDLRTISNRKKYTSSEGKVKNINILKSFIGTKLKDDINKYYGLDAKQYLRSSLEKKKPSSPPQPPPPESDPKGDQKGGKAL